MPNKLFILKLFTNFDTFFLNYLSRLLFDYSILLLEKVKIRYGSVKWILINGSWLICLLNLKILILK